MSLGSIDGASVTLRAGWEALLRVGASLIGVLKDIGG